MVKWLWKSVQYIQRYWMTYAEPRREHATQFRLDCSPLKLLDRSSPTGLYIFFNLRQIISGSTGPIFTIFSQNERYLREFSRLRPLFLYGRCHGNRFWAKFAKWPLFNMLSFRNGFKYHNSASDVITVTIFATLCAILMKICPLISKISQRVSVPFRTRRQKTTYHT